MMKLLLYSTVFLNLLSWHAKAQSDKEQALKLGRRAVELTDQGKLDESVALLRRAAKLDPGNLDYPYEIAYAYYQAAEYQKAIDMLSPLTTHQNTNDRVFQLLGNSWDNAGNRDKAIEVYKSGLAKFHASGKLYMELGGMYLTVKDYDMAVRYYEEGVMQEPAYPSNYYWLAKVYLNSEEEVWGMIYGEIFMNLERNSDRTSEMSKMLFDTYKSQITFAGDSSFNVSFCKNVIGLKKSKKPRLPFGLAVYEPTLILSLIDETNIDIDMLDRVRTRFVKYYYQHHHNKKYPNVLFDFQKSVLDAGQLEAYNHWILMKGEEQKFNDWYEANKDKWDAFVQWFNPHGLQLDKRHKFFRKQYD